MPTRNLSIAPSDHVQFSWTGWPQEAKVALQQSVMALAGVTGFDSAGGGDAFNVRHDGAISRDDLIASVNDLADQALPGHNFASR